MGQGAGGHGFPYVVGVVYCIAGLALTGAAVASAFIQVSDRTPLAGSLFVCAFLLSFPAIVAIIATQLSRYGQAVQVHSYRGGVAVPLRGPYLLGVVVGLSAAAFVVVTALVGLADAIWNRGAWSLLVAAWPELAFTAGLSVLNRQSYPG